MSRFDKDGRPIPDRGSTYTPQWPPGKTKAPRRGRSVDRPQRDWSLPEISWPTWLATPELRRKRYGQALTIGWILLMLWIWTRSDDDVREAEIREVPPPPVVTQRMEEDGTVTEAFPYDPSRRENIYIIDAATLDRFQNDSPQTMTAWMRGLPMRVTGPVHSIELGEADNNLVYLEGTPPIALDVGSLAPDDGSVVVGNTLVFDCLGGMHGDFGLTLFDCTHAPPPIVRMN